MTKHLVISPHCDDAMLSMGGRILTLDETTVVTVFGTCAWTTLSKEYTPDEITKRNQAEERKVMNAANVTSILYELPEALLRGYKKWNTAYLHDSDKLHEADISRLLRKHTKGMSRIYFPLAVGGHVDHVLVARQLLVLHDELRDNETEMFVYEDLPYSWYGGLDKSIALMQKNFTLTPYVADITNVMERKVRLLEYYKSQLAKADIDKVKKYAESLVTSGYGERIWQIKKR